MNFTFFNPLLLAGLAAAILPVLIHRITRKKAIVRKFSAVRLLMRSQLVTARPQRLKHLLLLALRILAVAGIVFMMARPVMVRPGFAALPDNGARVLILDNSPSMGFREESRPRFELAKEAAAAALKNFGGRAALIPTVPGADGPALRWLTSGEALKALQGMSLSFGRGDVVSAFGRAYRLLENLNVPKQILVFSDMASSDWKDLVATEIEVVSNAEISFFRIGGSGRDPNFCVQSVGLADGEVVAGVPSTLAVTVSNLSDEDADIPVQLYLNGKKTDQKTANLKSGFDGSVLFDVLIEKTGWMDGEIKLAGDRLAADDAFYFPLKVNDKVNVLIVDGDPTASLAESESFYLNNALRPGGLDGTPFLVRIITEAELPRVDPQQFDVLCLLNVARPDFSQPAAFLEAGRPVFIFLGDRVLPEAYNQFAPAPWFIQHRIDRSANAAKQTGIHQIEASLQFPAALETSLKSALFNSYYKVDSTGKALLTLKDKTPLLLAADSGKSQLYLFTSSADLDWNNLPLKAAFVPLIHGLLDKATGLKGASLPAGSPWVESLVNDGQGVQVRGTAGGPGIYKFTRSGIESRLGVNIPHEESELAKLSAAELKKKFGSMDIQFAEYQKDRFENQRGGRREIWPLLLGLLLFILAVEMVLANDILPLSKAAGTS